MNEFRQRLTVWYGLIGSLLFVAIFVAEDVFSPDFNWLSTAVSEHSRTPHGWIQITTFILWASCWSSLAGASPRSGATRRAREQDH